MFRLNAGASVSSMASLTTELTGTLFFPVTPFDEDGEVDLDAYRTHLASNLAFEPGGVFAACGTGEFHAIDAGEYRLIARETVALASGRTPVFTGAGGAVRAAREFARIAREEGVDGLLVMPPYLVAGTGEGLVSYIASIVEIGLPVIVYHRGTARLDESTALTLSRMPGVIGIKDGVGDLEAMRRIVRVIEDDRGPGAPRFLFFNGLPTAEVTQAAYRAIGVDLYSSAAFAFVPDVAVAFRRALERGDGDTLARLEREFYHPVARLRDRRPGYAVALVKAGVSLGGIAAGSVRPPLTDLTREERDELAELIARGRAVTAELAG